MIGHRIALVFLASLLLCPNVSAKDQYIFAPDKDAKIYFGHVSWVEIENDGLDPVVVRESGVSTEIATLNFPIGPGDIIRTSPARRLEIQFDTGTILRLDTDTELRVETILAQTLTHRGRRVTNLVLDKGQVYLMYKRYDRPEIFQIKTASAAFKPRHNSVAVLAFAESSGAKIQVMEGSVDVLFGPDWEEAETRKIKPDGAAAVSPDHEFSFIPGRLSADFEGWNLVMNESFLEEHEGKSLLPKPIRRLPKAIHYFAQKFGNRYGDWVWDVMYGWAWRPFVNSDYPWGGWTPYVNGYWRELNGQMYWVPNEPWGWVPYHLGIWTWDADKGWLWIPGSAFAPAWVSWRFLFWGAGFEWRPLFLWDWMGGLSMGDGGYFDIQYCSLYLNMRRDPEGTKKYYRIRKDQLQPPPYPIPHALKKAYKNVVKAVKSGNPHLLRRFENRPPTGFLVRGRDLHSRDLAVRRVKPADLTDSTSRHRIQAGAEPATAAAMIYQRNRMRDHVRRLMILNPGSGPDASGPRLTIPPPRARVFPDEGSVRDGDGGGRRLRAEPAAVASRRPGNPSSPAPRDWNPDMRSAQRMGVSIRYNSRRNEVECPELGLRSRAPGQVGRSGSFASGGSGGTSGGGGASSGGGAGSGGGSRGSIASSSGGRGSAGRSGGRSGGRK